LGAEDQPIRVAGNGGPWPERASIQALASRPPPDWTGRRSRDQDPSSCARSTDWQKPDFSSKVGGLASRHINDVALAGVQVRAAIVVGSTACRAGQRRNHRKCSSEKFGTARPLGACHSVPGRFRSCRILASRKVQLNPSRGRHRNGPPGRGQGACGSGEDAVSHGQQGQRWFPSFPER